MLENSPFFPRFPLKGPTLAKLPMRRCTIIPGHWATYQKLKTRFSLHLREGITQLHEYHWAGNGYLIPMEATALCPIGNANTVSKILPTFY